MIPPSRLAALDLFDGAPSRVLATLAAGAVEVSYVADEVIFTEGSAPRGWFVVLEGQVRVMRVSGSRQHIVHTEGPGGTLGEVPLFADGTHPAMGVAAEPTRCALWSRRALQGAVAANADVAFLLLRRLALRVRGLVERLDGRSAHTVQARLAGFLLTRPSAANGGSISLGMTQQRLAEEIGTVREVVSRELRTLIGEGLIARRGGNRFTVLDAARLGKIAD
jgi:CRP/FNR family transcriptional regulator